MKDFSFKNIIVKIPHLKSFVIVFAFLSLIYPHVSNSADKLAPISTDNIMNGMLSAVADMTVERAKQVRDMYISNSIREDLCGYDKWGTTLYMNRQLNVYFPEVCKSVRYKWGVNISFDPNFINAVKNDILDNFINSFFAFHYKDKIELVVKGVEAKYLRKVYLENHDVAIKDANNNVLKNTKQLFRRHYTKGGKVLGYFKELYDNQKTRDVFKNDIELINKLNSIINYLDVDNKIHEIILVSAYIELKNQMNISLIKLNTELKLESEIAKLKEIEKSIKVDLLDKYSSWKSFSDEVESKIVRYNDFKNESVKVTGYYNKFIIYYEYLRDQLNLKTELNDKELKLLSMFISIIENPGETNIKSLLETYASDVNSREIRYWERVWSVGTLAGFSAGSSLNNTQTGVSAFVPFGLLSTKGQSKSFMIHFFDLGQYLNYSDQDHEVEWQDALMPGFSYIFARYRRYPINFGVDVSYIPKRSKSNVEEDVRYSLFVSMEFPIWELN